MATPQDLTPDEFAALLKEVSKDVVPSEAPVETAVDRLAKHRETLVAYRKAGFSTKQIVAFLKDPRFRVQASVSTIRRVLGSDKKKRRSSGAVKYAVAPATATPPAPPKAP